MGLRRRECQRTSSGGDRPPFSGGRRFQGAAVFRGTPRAESPVAFGDNVIGMTVSVGLAMARKSDHSIEQIIAGADTALYRAKESGRNRTIAH
jgi:GGDEF domain-containing protein